MTSVQHAKIEQRRDKTILNAPEALEMLPELGLDADNPDAGVGFLETAADARDRPAGAYARDEGIDAREGGGDLAAGGAVVRLDVGLPLELPQQVDPLRLSDFLGGVYGSSHAAFMLAPGNLHAINGQEVRDAGSHAAGEDDSGSVASLAGDEGQRYGRVTAARLDNGVSGLEKAPGFAFFHQGHRDSVFHAAGGVLALKLCEDTNPRLGREPRQFYKRCASNQG